MNNEKSKWIDKRDIPSRSRFGKYKKPVGCWCDDSTTCGVCLRAADERSKMEREEYERTKGK